MTPEELILSHQGLVRSEAKKIHAKMGGKMQMDDLIGHGQVGLAQAAKSFDPERGVAFSTYAYYRIRGEMFEGIRASTWLPPAARRWAGAEAGADMVAEEEASRPEQSGAAEYQAQRFRDAVRRLGTVYLTAFATDDEGGRDVTDRSRREPDQERREVGAKVWRAIRTLPPNQQRAVMGFYVEGKTLTQIGIAEGKDKATISRWHAAAIDSLREALAAETGVGRAAPA